MIQSEKTLPGETAVKHGACPVRETHLVSELNSLRPRALAVNLHKGDLKFFHGIHSRHFEFMLRAPVLRRQRADEFAASAQARLSSSILVS